MGIQKVLNEEALRCLRDLAGCAVQNVADLTVLRLRDDRLRRRRHRDGGAVLPNAVDCIRDGVRIHQRAHTVMDKHHGISGEQLINFAEAVINRLLSGLAAGHNGLHLGDVELVAQLPHLRNVLPQARDHDSVDLVIVLELLDRIDDDRLAVELQKLLGNALGVHALSGSAGKNQCDIHVSYFHLSALVPFCSCPFLLSTLLFSFHLFPSLRLILQTEGGKENVLLPFVLRRNLPVISVEPCKIGIIVRRHRILPVFICHRDSRQDLLPLIQLPEEMAAPGGHRHIAGIRIGAAFVHAVAPLCPAVRRVPEKKTAQCDFDPENLQVMLPLSGILNGRGKSKELFPVPLKLRAGLRKACCHAGQAVEPPKELVVICILDRENIQKCAAFFVLKILPGADRGSLQKDAGKRKSVSLCRLRRMHPVPVAVFLFKEDEKLLQIRPRHVDINVIIPGNEAVVADCPETGAAAQDVGQTVSSAALVQIRKHAV